MTTIHFYLQPSLRPNRPGSIHLRITHRRQTRSIALPIKVHPCDWDARSEYSNNESINKQLDEKRLLIGRIITLLSSQGVYTADDIALRYRCLAKGNSLLAFTTELSSIYIRHSQERTARAYLTAARRLCQFCRNKNLLVSQITSSLMVDFERRLQDEGLTGNTISFYMRNLRAIYNKAVQMQLIIPQEVSPFKYVFTGREKTIKRALSKDEVNRLNNVNIHGNRQLRFARQLFFFGFHAKGMSFVDMAYLKKSDYKNGILRYRRKKTGRIIEVKVTRQLRTLIDFFAPMTRDSEYLLPIITNPEKNERLQYESALRLQNSRLKTLGRLSDLTDKLSTHVSRHTWASLAKQINTPLAVISESLGHSDEKTTQIYLASFDRKILDRVGERVSDLIRHFPPANSRGIELAHR